MSGSRSKKIRARAKLPFLEMGIELPKVTEYLEVAHTKRHKETKNFYDEVTNLYTTVTLIVNPQSYRGLCKRMKKVWNV